MQKGTSHKAIFGALISILCCNASLRADEATPAAERRYSADVSLNYARSTASPSTADFSESWGVNYGLAWKAGDGFDLGFKSAFNREIGAAEEKFRAGNSQIYLASRPPETDEPTSYGWTTGVVLPTAEDDKEYLGFQGSMLAGGSVTRSLSGSTITWLAPLSIGSKARGSRSFYSYDANKAGRPNTLWSLSLGGFISYQLSDPLSFSASLDNTRAWNSNGGSGTDSFEFSAGFDYAVNDKLSIGISEVTSNRTFAYDRVTPNLALYDSRLSAVVTSVSYRL